ncbi:hypothetical protein ACIPY6_03180 [Streptomyces sp. NPDC090054]|uniref:hypothetical protein n=1 Tax=Streptomyces sp. NPDC090054 TaxID=3365933 RepID=UPI003821FF28
MNTKSIAGAARVICEAMGRPNAVPATIAVALDAGGWLNTGDAAAELVRLRLLQNAQPAELSEPQLEALIDAGNAARNDYYHERACSCSEWPAGCVTDPDYANGYWDSDTFAIAAAAVVGAWESMRTPAEADEIARLRKDRDAFRDQRNGVFADNEQLIARVQESSEARLRAENATRTAQREIKQLRARVAELEAAQTRPAPMFDPAAGLERLRREVAGLPGQAPPVPQREEPHDSPLHHVYKTGRDLPRRVDACDACGAVPGEWCPDCAACRAGCHGGHDNNPCDHANAPWMVRRG